MIPRIGVVTIVSKNYLAFARTLMASVREHYPDAIRFVVLVDTVDDYFDPDLEDFVVIPSDILGIPNSHWFHFKYAILELNTAIKPYAIEYLIHTHGLERVFYFDPDIRLYDSISELGALLDSHDILLTPHLSSPLPEDGGYPDELALLRVGAYNLGFIAVRASENTDAFLRWWQRKLYDHCYVDFERGLFTDQKWIDLVPGSFQRVHVVRSPQYNAAYWNLANRPLTVRESGWYADGERLCFFHFSGFDPLNPQPFSKYQNRFTLDTAGSARRLALDYAAEVISNGHEECTTWPYAYSSFRNGQPITDCCRRYVLQYPEVTTLVRDPFSAAGFAAYVDYWTEIVEGDLASGMPRLPWEIIRQRPDLQRLFPDIRGANRTAYLEWFVANATQEFRVPGFLLEKIRTMLRLAHPGIDSVQAAEKTKMISAAVKVVQRTTETAALRSTAASLSTLSAEAEILRSQIVELNLLLEDRQRRLNELLNSLSWKSTAPLRALWALIRPSD